MTNDTNACREAFEKKTHDYHEGRFERTNLGDYINAEVQDNWVIWCSAWQARAEQDKEAPREVRERLRKSLTENDSGDKHNDYSGLYFDVAESLATLDKLLGETYSTETAGSLNLRQRGAAMIKPRPCPCGNTAPATPATTDPTYQQALNAKLTAIVEEIALNPKPPVYAPAEPVDVEALVGKIEARLFDGASIYWTAAVEACAKDVRQHFAHSGSKEAPHGE